MIAVKRIIHSLRAFSLIETIAAITIFAVVSLPLLHSHRLSYQATHRYSLHLRAIFFAHEVRERLRRLTDYECAHSNKDIALPKISINPPEGFTFDVTSKNRSTGLLEILITVRWQFLDKPKSTSLASVISLRSNTGSPRRDG